MATRVTARCKQDSHGQERRTRRSLPFFLRHKCEHLFAQWQYSTGGVKMQDNLLQRVTAHNSPIPSGGGGGLPSHTKDKQQETPPFAPPPTPNTKVRPSTHQPSLTAAAAQPARGRCGEFAEDCFRFSGNSSNPLQPEPPRVAAARPTNKDGAGVRGETLFVSAPAAFRRFRRAKAASKPQQGQET